jgi:hypothetical protein
MLYSRPQASAHWNALKLAAAATAVAVLAGCAVAVPLRPLTTTSQDGRDRDFACRANSRCFNAITSLPRTSRRSQPVGGGNVVDDPPDFILNSEQGILR